MNNITLDLKDVQRLLTVAGNWAVHLRSINADSDSYTLLVELQELINKAIQIMMKLEGRTMRLV